MVSRSSRQGASAAFRIGSASSSLAGWSSDASAPSVSGVLMSGGSWLSGSASELSATSSAVRDVSRAAAAATLRLVFFTVVWTPTSLSFPFPLSFAALLLALLLPSSASTPSPTSSTHSFRAPATLKASACPWAVRPSSSGGLTPTASAFAARAAFQACTCWCAAVVVPAGPSPLIELTRLRLMAREGGV